MSFSNSGIQARKDPRGQGKGFCRACLPLGCRQKEHWTWNPLTWFQALLGPCPKSHHQLCARLPWSVELNNQVPDQWEFEGAGITHIRS